MALIPRPDAIDLAILPIGDTFTMGVDDALTALGMLHAKAAIPMHYNTFDRIRQDPRDFATRAADLGVEARVLAPGDSCFL